MFFQRWPEANRVRPDFEVLHLGEPAENWFGRTTPQLGETKTPPEAEERLREFRETFRIRRATGSMDHERLR
jgi:hypothetical protein